MPKKHENGQKESTRRRILDVARRIFARKGYEGASVDAIVRASELSKGALYWHFPGKLELYREVMGEQAQSIHDHFKIPEKLKGHVDPLGFLIERGMALIDELNEDSERRLLWMDLSVVAQRGDTRSRALAGEIIDGILDTLLPEMDAALLPGRDLKRGSLESRERILCLTHFFDGLVVNLGIRLKPEEAKRYWEMVTRMLFEEGCAHEES